MTLALLALLAVPWWDDHPTTIQTNDAEVAARYGASSVLCGQADDPAWGILGARVRDLSFAHRIEPLRRLGLPLLSWVETFGTSQSYIARFERRPDGGLLGFELDSTCPRPTLNHWAWQLYQPADDDFLAWIGLPAYYDDAPWARPWTRAHPRYGAPPMRYPDGRVAEGYAVAGDESSARCWDAGGSKDILGRLNLFLDASERVDPAAQPAAVAPLVRFEQDGVTRYASSVGVGKDAACPHWIEYAAASARYVVDQGMRGVWADNFSAWDNLGNPPVRVAFGDWSVARFRERLARAYTAAELAELGVDDPATFDIRAHLRRLLRERFGGDDGDLADPRWRDPRWTDEPLWREYLIFKQQVGRAALQAFHDAFHTAAREAGIDDFGIQGNDIPSFSFGMPRPESLEMVSTEFSPGWNLLGGPRGIGLPPGGRLAPVVKLARVHARSRFVHLWYYLEAHLGYDRLIGDEQFGRTIAYELLASQASIQAYPSARKVAGTEASHGEVYGFVNACREVWGDRLPLAVVGLVYSPESSLCEFTPGGFADMSRQSHVHELLGWGTALSHLGVPYEVVPEWDLTAARLAPLRVLVLPSVMVLAPEVIDQVIEPWVRAGGRLHITGATGTRHDAARHWDPADTPSGRHPSLCRLAGIDPAQAIEQIGTSAVRPLGAGARRFTPAFEGLDYYAVEPAERTEELLRPFRAWVRGAAFLDEPLPGFEVVYYALPTRPIAFVDLADLRRETEPAVIPPRRVTLPGAPDGELAARLLEPGHEPRAIPLRRRGATLELPELSFTGYASIVIEGWRVGGAE